MQNKNCNNFIKSFIKRVLLLSKRQDDDILKIIPLHIVNLRNCFVSYKNAILKQILNCSGWRVICKK